MQRRLSSHRQGAHSGLEAPPTCYFGLRALVATKTPIAFGVFHLLSTISHIFTHPHNNPVRLMSFLQIHSTDEDTGHREIVKSDQGLPARKGQEWDSNPRSEAQWPVPNHPQLSLGQRQNSHGPCQGSGHLYRCEWGALFFFLEDSTRVELNL